MSVAALVKEVALTALLAFLLSICSVGQSSVLRRRLYKIVLQFLTAFACAFENLAAANRRRRKWF